MSPLLNNSSDLEFSFGEVILGDMTGASSVSETSDVSLGTSFDFLSSMWILELISLHVSILPE